MGERVGIGWQADSCGICEWCRQGDEHLCAKAQPTCVGRNGGYADRIRVNSRFAIPVPTALESENVAPLLCARDYGLLARCGTMGAAVVARGRDWDWRAGASGIQFAKAFGAEVTAFSTSKDKEAEAKELGAHHFVNTRDTGALKKVAGSFDLLLSTVSADQDWQAYVNALRPKGTLCLVGRRRRRFSCRRFSLMSGRRRFRAVRRKSADLHEMLDVAARHGVKAITERFAMAKANDAVAKVKKNQVRYRAVLAN